MAKRRNKRTTKVPPVQVPAPATIELACSFCQGGPLDCECHDVAMDDFPSDLEDALDASRMQWAVVTKLGREKTAVLIKELGLDPEQKDTWRALESMAQWA